MASPGWPADERPPAEAVWVRLNRYIGDSVMIHQAVEPLRALGLPLVAWGPPAVVDLFRGSRAFAGSCSDPDRKPGALAMARVLREGRAAAVLALPRSARPLLAGFLAGVAVRVGWRENGGWLAATCTLPFTGLAGHQVDRYATLIARGFPAARAVPAVPFVARPEAVAEGLRRLEETGLGAGFLALSLGAASHNKRLPASTWIALVRHLRAQGRPHLLLGSGQPDQEQAGLILQACPGTPSLVGQLGLAASAGLLAAAGGLVGNDSGLSHLAAACGIEVVVAFGPTEPALTLPRGRVRMIRRDDLDCIACLDSRCRLGDTRCLQGLDPAAVIAGADRIPWSRPEPARGS